jgi:hypothetical protein
LNTLTAVSPNKHCGTQVAGCYVKATSSTERKTTFSLNKRKTDIHPQKFPGNAIAFSVMMIMLHVRFPWFSNVNTVTIMHYYSIVAFP